MNAQMMAKAAYAAPQPTLRSPRSIECDLMTRITARLVSAHNQGKEGFNALVSALHDNRKLWILFASEVAEDGNGLSEPLRVQILSLAQFTVRHTSLILEGKEDAQPLIDINTAIIRGLSGSEEAA